MMHHTMTQAMDQSALVQAILRDLEAPDVFPAGALLCAKSVQRELEPHLLAIFKKDLEAVQSDEDEDTETKSFFTLFLLAEFRSPALYPLLVEALRLSEIQLEVLMGDALTELVPRMLAVHCAGQEDVLWGLFDDKSLYEFSRSAALNAILVALVNHKITAEAVVPQIEKRLAVGRADVVVDLCGTTMLVNFILDARLSSLYDTARRAFECNMVDADMFRSWQEFEEIWNFPVRGGNKYHAFVESAFKELAAWGGMREVTVPIALGGAPISKMGRNDRCICGSAKKYKKCCMAYCNNVL